VSVQKNKIKKSWIDRKWHKRL